MRLVEDKHDSTTIRAKNFVIRNQKDEPTKTQIRRWLQTVGIPTEGDQEC